MSLLVLLLLRVSLLVVIVLLVPTCLGDLDADRETLYVFYNATGGADWEDNTGWATGDSDMSSWYGLTIASDGSSVTEIYLFSNNLVGEIPPEIGDLTALERLELGSNVLSGEIPAEIGNLATLQILDLGVNYLEGPIPPELGALQNLLEIELNTNFLTGTIPVEIADPELLTGVWLHDNDLEGGIPSRLGERVEMQTINLSGNQLTGEIPVSLGNLTTMRYLNLADNLLVGEIHEGIGSLTVRASLTWALQLQNNYLSGTVPEDIESSSESYPGFDVDLSNNMLDGWPDQREDGATEPPQTSSSSASPSIGSSASSSSSSGGTDAGSTTIGDGGSTSTGGGSSSGTGAGGDPSIGGGSSSSSSGTGGSSSSSSNSAAATPAPSPTKSTATTIAAIVGSTVGAVALIAGAITCLLCRRRRRAKRSMAGLDAGSPALPGDKQYRKEQPPPYSSLSGSQRNAFLPLSGAAKGNVAGSIGDDADEDSGDSYSWTRDKADLQYFRRNGSSGSNGTGKTVSGSLAEIKAGGGGGGVGGSAVKAAPPPRSSIATSSSVRLLSLDASARLHAPTSLATALYGKSSEDKGGSSSHPVAVAPTGGSVRSTSSSTAAPPPTALEGAASTALDIATAALTAAEELAQQSFVPGVREAATVVAGLVRLASDHKTNPREAEKRARWCRSIVHTLERAAEVLGKTGGKDGEAAHILLEDVQDSIEDMMQIMQSYRSKNMLSKLFVSSLCKKRQEEAEVSINAAVQRLQLGLQVRVGHKLEAVGEAVQEGLDFQRRASKESATTSKRERRQRRLNQLEIPVSEVGITEEVLGRGGFGTVYLADLHGLNAAAKVIIFEDEGDDEDEDDDDDRDDDHDDNGDANNGDWRQDPLAGRAGSRKGFQAASGGKGLSAAAGRPQLPTKSQEQRQRRAFMRELEAMKRLRGPHTVAIYGAVTSLPDRLVLVMELLPGGDLRHRLRKAKEPLEPKVLRQIVRDVCSGMVFLHSKQTVHGDLKSANVLFSAAGRAKIADFGTSLWTQHTTRLATYTTKPRETVGLSLPWAAPEVLNRNASSFQTDVYSFGVVVWECLTRQVPWKGIAGVDKLVLAVTAGERPPLPENVPQDLAALVQACWAHEPAARPTFKSTLANLNVLSAQDAIGGVGEQPASSNRRGGRHKGEDSMSMLAAASGIIFAARKPATRSSSFAASGRSKSSSSSGSRSRGRGGRSRRAAVVPRRVNSGGAVDSRGSGSGGFFGGGAGSGDGDPKGASSESSESPSSLSSSSSESDLSSPSSGRRRRDASVPSTGTNTTAVYKTEEEEDAVATTTAELTLTSSALLPPSPNRSINPSSGSRGRTGWRGARGSKGDAAEQQRRQECSSAGSDQKPPPPPPYRLTLPLSRKNSGSVGPSGRSAAAASVAPRPVGRGPSVGESGGVR